MRYVSSTPVSIHSQAQMLTDHVSGQHINVQTKCLGYHSLQGTRQSGNLKSKVNIACVHLGQTFDTESKNEIWIEDILLNTYTLFIDILW
jgi:hypothetical protein